MRLARMARMATEAPREIYEKLLRCLEYGRKKEEKSLVELLRTSFGAGLSDDLVEHLVDVATPEKVFSILVRALEPWALMLDDIYSFLSTHATSVTGKADVFCLKHADLDVEFDLRHFPKQLTHAIVSSDRQICRLDLAATANLIVDVPLAGDYRLDVNAAHNLATGVATGICENWLVDGAPLSRRDAALAEQVIGVARRVLRAVDGDAASELDLRLLTRIANSVPSIGSPADGARALAHEPFDLAAQAVLEAADAALDCITEPVDLLEQVIDEVMLPFWRHRWRLYEVWALVMLLRSVPADASVALSNVVDRPDEPGAVDWILPHGKASNAVAAIKGGTRELQVWFQYESEVPGGHIEPDIRVRYGEADVFVFELKDRRSGSLAAARRVATTYARGTPAAVVWLTNYMRFGGERGKPRPTVGGVRERRSVDGTDVWIADELRPGDVPREFEESFHGVLRSLIGGWSLLVDVSGSMYQRGLDDEIRALVEEHGLPSVAHVFTATLARLPESKLLNPFEIEMAERTTDLARAVDEADDLVSPGDTRLVVITDADGEVDARALADRFGVTVDLRTAET